MTDRIVFNVELFDPQGISEIFCANERCKPGAMSICRFTIYRQENRRNAISFRVRFLLNVLR